MLENAPKRSPHQPPFFPFAPFPPTSTPFLLFSPTLTLFLPLCPLFPHINQIYPLSFSLFCLIFPRSPLNPPGLSTTHDWGIERIYPCLKWKNNNHNYLTVHRILCLILNKKFQFKLKTNGRLCLGLATISLRCEISNNDSKYVNVISFLKLSEVRNYNYSLKVWKCSL